MSLSSMIENMAKDAGDAARQMRKLESAQKDAALKLMAARLLKRQSEIIKENQKDLSKARESGLSDAMIDRLTLDEKGIQRPIRS